MHPVKYHLTNKLTWMARQLRRKNNAPDVTAWVSAMHSTYNLLVVLSRDTAILKDEPQNERRKPETLGRKIVREKRVVEHWRMTDFLSSPRKTETNTSVKQRRLVKGKRQIVKVPSSPINIAIISAPEKEPTCDETTSTRVSNTLDMNIDRHDNEELFSKSQPLPSQNDTPIKTDDALWLTKDLIESGTSQLNCDLRSTKRLDKKTEPPMIDIDIPPPLQPPLPQVCTEIDEPRWPCFICGKFINEDMVEKAGSEVSGRDYEFCSRACADLDKKRRLKN